MSLQDPDLPPNVKLLHAARPQAGADTRRAQLVSLLLRESVPGKDEILQVKKLVREIADEGATAPSVCVKTFVSSYFDLYLGRVTGDASIEKAALRRCLACLGVEQPKALGA